MSMEKLSQVSERAVKLAIKRGADQAQAVAFERIEDLTRFANSQIHQNVSTRMNGLNLRVVLKKRIGDISVASTDPKSIELAVKDAIKIAKLTPPK